MVSDITQYLFDVADNWAALLTGGIPAAALLIFERIRGKSLSLRTFAFLLACGFGAASFQAHNRVSGEWKAAKSANTTLQSDVKTVTDQLADARRQLVEANKWRPSPTLNVPLAGVSVTNITVENSGGDGFVAEGNLKGFTFDGIASKNTKGVGVRIDSK